MSREVKEFHKVGDLLYDLSATGKDRKWSFRKSENLKLSEKLNKVNSLSNEILDKKLCSEDVLNRIFECGETLMFKENNNGLKLEHAFFCKNKFCPICMWRKSLKHAQTAKKILEKFTNDYPKARYIHLTLTAKNCQLNDLSKAITELNRSFNRLMKYEEVDKFIFGFLRGTEVTFSEFHNTFNQHMHILIAVKSSYYKKDNYISQEKWSKLWSKAMRVDYIPIVYVQNIKAKKLDLEQENSINDISSGIQKELFYAILETAKYPIKPIVVKNPKKELEVLMYLFHGLKGKRQIGYGKIFKEIKKELNYDDNELILIDEDKQDIIVDSYRVYCKYLYNYYRIVNKRLFLKTEQLEEINMNKNERQTKYINELYQYTKDFKE